MIGHKKTDKIGKEFFKMIIPKIIHRIWLGGNPFPKKFEKYGKTWEDNHPDWIVKLWTDDNLPDLINQKSIELCNTYSEISDLVRYELLYSYGGVYVDVDFECFKNIEPLIKNFAIFASTENNNHICGGIIGSTPQHPVIGNLIDKIPKALEDSIGKTSDLRIGPSFVTDNIDKKEINILPKKYFYPYLPGEYKKKIELKNNKVAYAAHHWAGSWLEPSVNGNKISIIIPYTEPTENDGGYRMANYYYTREKFRQMFPEAEIIRGYDTSESEYFCRAHSINNGVENSTGDVLIISDGDILINKETIEKAVFHLTKSPFIIPFGRCYDLNQEITDKILDRKIFNEQDYRKHSDYIRDIREGHSQFGDKMAGGIQIMTRDIFDTVGGYSEKFVGWGYEDTHFCKKMQKELDDYLVLEEERIYHLWHPRSWPNLEYNRNMYETLIKEQKL